MMLALQELHPSIHVQTCQKNAISQPVAIRLISSQWKEKSIAVLIIGIPGNPPCSFQRSKAAGPLPISLQHLFQAVLDVMLALQQLHPSIHVQTCQKNAISQPVAIRLISSQWKEKSIAVLIIGIPGNPPCSFQRSKAAGPLPISLQHLFQAVLDMMLALQQLHPSIHVQTCQKNAISQPVAIRLISSQWKEKSIAVLIIGIPGNPPCSFQRSIAAYLS